jgi:hypothetical protein
VNDAGETLLQDYSRDSPTLVLSKDGRTTTSVQSEGDLLTVLPPRGDIVYVQRKKKDDEDSDCVLVIVGREGNTILEPPPQHTWSERISVCGINENLAVADSSNNKTLDIFQNHTRK